MKAVLLMTQSTTFIKQKRRFYEVKAALLQYTEYQSVTRNNICIICESSSFRSR